MTIAISHPIEKKKQIGAFYTPPEVAKIIAAWAIRSAGDSVLEPSFGGCGFLEAARERLEFLESVDPASQIFGCDIDAQAFHHLETRFGVKDFSNRFIRADFLDFAESTFWDKTFTVVIGNPPYISHHKMEQWQKVKAYEVPEHLGVRLSKKSSLWAYFVLHGMRFIETGGRMAWVLPGSFLNADYGREVQAILAERFESLKVIVLSERLFISEGAEESSVILLCENFQKKSSESITIRYASSIPELKICIDNIELEQQRFSGQVAYDVLSPDAKTLIDKIMSNSQMFELSDFAEIKIGIVTGNNKFFVLNKESANNEKLYPHSCIPIIAKFKMIKGLNVTRADVDSEVYAGTPCLLVCDRDGCSLELSCYLNKYPTDKRETNKTFAKRKIWYRADDGKIPDAFLSYMQHDGPRLALNTGRFTSTNTVHRVYFKNVGDMIKKMTAISFASTVTQISAEMQGRSYGSGVLKHEPSEARKIKITIPKFITEDEISKIFCKVDSCLRRDCHDEARKIADETINRFLGLKSADAKLLEEVLRVQREIRQR